MLKKLFELENIKYVISVDDCFAEDEEEQLRKELYLESVSSFETVKPYLIKLGKKEQVKDIQDLFDIKADASSTIHSLIYSLKKEDVNECLQSIHPDKITLSIEQKGILEFLEKLKTDSIIEKYFTIPSTHEAEKFDINAQGMTDGAILWLIDKSFSKVGESDTAGFELAKNKIKQPHIIDNFVFMLTTLDSTSDNEEDIEVDFDKMLADNGTENKSFIYYIKKGLILTKKFDRIAKSLAYGFKRKQCYNLIDDYIECLSNSCVKTVEKLHNINQNTLNYVFTKKVQENGESYFDFFKRLVQIFHDDEYSCLLSEKRVNISTKINHYQNLCNYVPQEAGNLTDVNKNLAEVRKKELFDMYINQKHSEVSTGDIFKVKNSYYILVTQSCDTYLRDGGIRKLDNAILLKIIDSTSAFYKYELSCFCDPENSFKKAFVIFQDNCIIPFDVLDLCVANEDGQARINTSCFGGGSLLDFCFTSNYKKRFETMIKLFSGVYQSKTKLDQLLEHPEENIEKIKGAYKYLDELDSIIKDYKIANSSMIYPIQRIARLNELYTVALLNEYGHVLSRVGHPFDFMKDKHESI